MSHNKYQRGVVEKILDSQEKGITPAQMIDRNLVDVPVPTIMAIIRDAQMYGAENICAEGENLLEEEEAPAADDPFSPRRPHDFGVPEAEDAGTGAPEVAAAQAVEVEKKVRDQKRDLPRGKKPANVKDNISMNAEKRRRRGGNPVDMRRRLLADMSRLHPDFEHRWVLDRPGRIAEKTMFDDWDIVTDAHVMEGMGGNVQAIAGTNHYNADKMVLVRKRKQYFEADAKAKLQEVSVLEDQIKQGPQASQNGQHSVDTMGPKEVMERLKSGGLDTSNTYVPVGEKITIGQVSETP